MMRTLGVGLSLLLSLGCGPKHTQSTQSTNPDDPPRPAESAMSIGVVADAAAGLVFPLMRLEVVASAPVPDVVEATPQVLLESDLKFSEVAASIKGYPAKATFMIYSSTGSLSAKVGGVVVTRTGCGDHWAAYPLLITAQPLPLGDIAVLVRPDLVPSLVTSLRLLGISDAPPEALRALLAQHKPTAAPTEERYFVRMLELDGDVGAEVFVARLSLEPLGDAGVRAAWVEAFWFDEDKESWRMIEHSTRRIAQEDLLDFPRVSGWERYAAPPVLVLDLDADQTTELIREGLGGYSLWRYTAKELRMISESNLASEEGCE